MTLRTRDRRRSASLSVALAVLGAAIGLYLGVRSDLRGEVDSALRARARAFTARPSGVTTAAARRAEQRPRGRRPLRGRPPDRRAAPGRGPSPAGRAAFPGSVEPAPFGAASGYVQFITPSGAVEVPAGQGRPRGGSR